MWTLLIGIVFQLCLVLMYNPCVGQPDRSCFETSNSLACLSDANDVFVVAVHVNSSSCNYVSSYSLEVVWHQYRAPSSALQPCLQHLRGGINDVVVCDSSTHRK